MEPISIVIIVASVIVVSVIGISMLISAILSRKLSYAHQNAVKNEEKTKEVSHQMDELNSKAEMLEKIALIEKERAKLLELESQNNAEKAENALLIAGNLREEARLLEERIEDQSQELGQLKCDKDVLEQRIAILDTQLVQLHERVSKLDELQSELETKASQLGDKKLSKGEYREARTSERGLFANQSVDKPSNSGKLEVPLRMQSKA